MSKPRIYSPLDTLPLHVKQTILGWLTTGGKHGLGITYAEARARLHTEFGVKTNESSLCGFFKRHQNAPRATVATSEDAGGKTITITVTIPK